MSGDSRTKTTESDLSLQAVQEAFDRFIEAFRNVEWRPFYESFSEDATFFVPYVNGRGTPVRADGPGAVEAEFKPFFDELRRQSGDAAHIPIVPEDVKVQMLNDAAVVTFHLNEGAWLGRRTFIFRRQGDKWLIVHIHASAVER